MAFTPTIVAKRLLLLVKVETEYGSDPTPAKDKDVMMAYDVNISPDRDSEQRPEQVATFGTLGAVVGKTVMSFSFKTTTLGGKANEGPIESPLLQMSNMKETAATSEDPAIYYPESGIGGSATIYYFWDGALYKIKGCKANLVIRAIAGKAVEFEFTGKGLYAPASSESFVTDPTVPTLNPMIAKGLTAQVGDATLGMESIEINLGNEITESKDTNETYVVRSINIVKRAIRVTCNPEISPTILSTLETTINAGSTGTIMMNFVDGDYGLQIACLNAFLHDMKLGEREGKGISELSFIPAQSAAIDDELCLTYEPAA